MKAIRTSEKNKRGARGAGRLFKKTGNKQLPADSTATGNYYLTYTVNGKRQTQALRDADGHPITDRAQAENERRRILAPFAAGEQVDTLKAIRAKLADAETLQAEALEAAAPVLKIADAWRAFESEKVNRPKSGDRTLADYAGYWKRFAAWIADTHPELVALREVTDATAREYAAHLFSGGLSEASFNKHVRLLALVFRVLAEQGRITENPWRNPKRSGDGKGITRQEHTAHSRRELTTEELTAILATAPADIELLLWIGAATGLRLGDCCTLRWQDVDLAAGVIRRVPNKTARRHPAPVTIGIPQKVHDRLSMIPPKNRTGHVMPRLAARYESNPSMIVNAVKAHIWRCGIDVHAPGTGTQIERDADGLPVLDASGNVKTIETGRKAVVDVGFHSLRHTWVSMHAAAGTAAAIIQKSVGHSNPAMTAHYTHVNDSTARDVSRALPMFSNGTPAALPAREAVPAWIREALETMTGKNWKQVKAVILEGGAK
jgi:integrase